MWSWGVPRKRMNKGGITPVSQGVTFKIPGFRTSPLQSRGLKTLEDPLPTVVASSNSNAPVSKVINGDMSVNPMIWPHRRRSQRTMASWFACHSGASWSTCPWTPRSWKKKTGRMRRFAVWNLMILGGVRPGRIWNCRCWMRRKTHNLPFLGSTYQSRIAQDHHNN